MSVIRYIARGSCLLVFASLLAGCVVAPPDDGGYYGRGPDRDYHGRDYHDRSHDCRYRGDRGDRDDRDDRDEHCRR